MIGRVQVASGVELSEPAAALDLHELLHGEHSADVFMDLVRTYAASGVSGVVPKSCRPTWRHCSARVR